MKICVIDTETTGIPDRDPLARIIEVGAVIVDWDGGPAVKVLSTFESLVNPGRLFWERSEAAKALEVNRITPAMIKSAPPPWVVSAAMTDWVAGHRDGDSPMPLMAYGASFDFDPLLLSAPEWLGPYGHLFGAEYCLRNAAMDALGLSRYQRGYRLDDTLAHFGVARQGDAHSALSDALGAAMLIPHLLAWPLVVEPARSVIRRGLLTRSQFAERAAGLVALVEGGD